MFAPLFALLSGVNVATDLALLIEIEVEIGLIVVGAQTELITSELTLSSIFESWLGASRAVEFLFQSTLPLTCL